MGSGRTFGPLQPDLAVGAYSAVIKCAIMIMKSGERKGGRYGGRQSQEERIESVSLYESDQGVAAIKKQARDYARFT